MKYIVLLIALGMIAFSGLSGFESPVWYCPKCGATNPKDLLNCWKCREFRPAFPRYKSVRCKEIHPVLAHV